jgi:mannose/fructose-specific phosphotransferase system component IIA
MEMAELASTGIVMVLHGTYGGPLRVTAEELVGPLGVSLVQVVQGEGVADLRQRIMKAIADQESGGREILFLTDLCGSTPANICLKLIGERQNAEIVSGISLATLIKLSTCDRRQPAKALAQELLKSSQRSIQLGSDLLRRGEPCGD